MPALAHPATILHFCCSLRIRVRSLRRFDSIDTPVHLQLLEVTGIVLDKQEPARIHETVVAAEVKTVEAMVSL